MFFQKLFGKTKELSKSSAFIQNSTRLRNTALSIIRMAEKDNTKVGVSAEKDIMAVIDRHLQNANMREEIASWQDYNTDYIQKANAMLANITFSMLTSGEYHLWAGVLNEMGPANRLMDVFRQAVNWQLSHGFITKEEYDEWFTELRRRIKSI